MISIDITLKAITLLNRENNLGEQISDNSSDLVRTILTSLGTSGNSSLYQGGDSDILENLKHLLKDMVNNPDNYDQDTLLQSLELILKDKTSLLKVIDKTINVELSTASLKRTIISLRNTLNNYYKEQEIKSLISKASYKITTNNLGSESIQDFTSSFITNLDALMVTSKTKDIGIMDELDISDESNMSVMMDKVKVQSEDGGKLLTGWKELNQMLSGGFRRTEMVVIPALQHKYKSGFTRSLFVQLAMHNKPVMDDVTKKPLLLYISLEDDADIMVDFMYKYLYNNEHDKLPDMTGVTGAEIAKYIKDKLNVNGYHIKIVRVNPSEWTYKNLFNKILEYEADGYEIHAGFIDYLSKLPTTGCISGPMGTDIRDLFNRTRNFFSAHRILCVTPHQLSTEAKQLIRNGVPDINFVKEVQGKGYYSESKQIDQVVDLELYLHIAHIQRKPYLTVARGKHRIPTILEPEYMYFTLPFPKGAPIKPNINNASTDLGFGSDSVDKDDSFDF